jgi:hypothetical protein
MQTCPQCGYTEIVSNKPMHNVMNVYVQESKPSYEVTLNSIEDTVVFPADEATGKPERKFIKKSVYLKSQKPNPSIVKEDKVDDTGLVQAPIPAANTADRAIGVAIPTPPITPTPATKDVPKDAFGNPVVVAQP